MNPRSVHSMPGTYGFSFSGTAAAAAPALELTDLVCADPELLRQEFDELIAASWDGPPSDRPRGPRRCPARRPAPLGRRTHRQAVRSSRPVQDAEHAAAPARERGPPTAPLHV